jgi:hypothetical protein
MTKKEIIEALVCINVPSGAQLVQHDIPGGLQFATVRGPDVGGLKVVMAQILASQLEEDTNDLGCDPTPKLFARLHQSVLEFNETVFDNTLIEAVQDETVTDHRKIIERLRQIAVKIGIIYEEPEDRLLYPPKSD